MTVAITDRIKNLEPAAESAFETLRVIPLVGQTADEPAYRLFDESTKPSVMVTEVDSTGSIPDLTIVNNLDVHVLVIAGEELVGAKQNRVLNADVLVPPRTKQAIPVSCVEQGRWRFIRPDFVPGKMVHSSLRGKKSRDVAASLRRGLGHRSDQRAVWRRVAEVSRETGTSSATAALHDVYDQLESKLRPIRERFELPPDALGIAVFEGDRFLGVDVFDRPGALRHYWKCLVDSFALDWLARSARCGVCAGPTLRLGELLDEIGTGTWTEHASPGAGTDCRLDHDRLTGSALVWDGRSTVHLQVFPKE